MEERVETSYESVYILYTRVTHVRLQFDLQIISRRTKAKKHPTALTEEMLNELNKSHMGGFENYGADDLYNMEDVWNEKPFKHKVKYFRGRIINANRRSHPPTRTTHDL